MKTRLQHQCQLEADVDTMLADLWLEAFEVEEWTLELVGQYMRSAFGHGYLEALTEPVAGSFCKRNGYSTPKRRRA